jgi:hypothetical protein
MTNWRKLAINLLDQQMWCWGQDALFREGNLLVSYGFQRLERPRGQEGSSLYRLEQSASRRILLRGFGVFIGDDQLGGMFLQRFNFDPRVTPQSDLVRPAWLPSDLPRLVKPNSERQDKSCQSLLADLFSWNCQYEEWVQQSVGLDYRTAVARDWKKRGNASFTSARLMPSTWLRLRNRVLSNPDDFGLRRFRIERPQRQRAAAE